jgi:hypothetical protein
MVVLPFLLLQQEMKVKSQWTKARFLTNKHLNIKKIVGKESINYQPCYFSCSSQSLHIAHILHFVHGVAHLSTFFLVLGLDQ